MTVSDVPSAPSPILLQAHGKRKGDALEKSEERKKAAYDLAPLFSKILAAINSGDNGAPLPYQETIDLLSMDEEVLFSLQQTPLSKIKELFKKYLVNSEEGRPHQKRIKMILSDLYPIALFNSSIRTQLAQTAQELPKLKEKVTQNATRKLHDLMRDGRELRRHAQYCSSLETAEELIPQIEELLARLDEFRKLKQYQDREENNRMLFLSKHLVKQRAAVRYPEINSQYRPLIEKLKSRSIDLTSVSSLVQGLNRAKLQLQKMRAASMAVDQEENPLETRFLKGFSSPFYNAFAGHFWTLLWNSQGDPEVKEILLQFPDSDTVRPEEISIAFLNEVWTRYLPDSDFEAWMLKSLAATPEIQLASLESALQAKTKAINEIHENKEIHNGLKQQMERPHYQEMEQLCSEATKPSFATLAELRTFLK